uniref:Platelet-derived growth factor (PDGF) family profile domain-containing protein n=2 Tax=Clytia hemisphaerica TaxID=252671 RepID=A0A7M5X878_9CNID
SYKRIFYKNLFIIYCLSIDILVKRKFVELDMFYQNIFLFVLMLSVSAQDKSVPENVLKKLQGGDLETLFHKLRIEEPRQRGFDAILFPNQPCLPRKTVIEVPQPSSVSKIHFPYYVEVHRCAGGCGPMQFLSRCQPKETKKVRAKVIALTWTSGNPEDEIPPALAYVAITNHTSCECGCKHEGNECNRFQFWDTARCRCNCMSWGCPKNFEKDPNNCCACPIRERFCPARKQEWIQSRCACVCKNLHKKCRIPLKIRDPNTCKCVCPPIICRSGSKLDSKTCHCQPDNS